MESSRTEGPALLVDGTGLMVRTARAGMRTGMSANGVITGPLFLFIRSLSRVIRDHKPADIVVCFDGENGQAWRRGIWPGYKRNRAPCRFEDDRDFLIVDFCGRAKMGMFWHKEWEADDFVAAAWRAFRRQGRDVVIYAADADYHQLLDEGTVQVTSSAKQLWTPQLVREYYGCDPEQLPTLRALEGDRSDGIPGLPGVGPRTALQRLYEPLPEQAQVFRRIIDLRAPECAPDQVSIGRSWWSQEAPRMKWHAGDAADGVLPFLRFHELATIAEQLEAGKLW